MTRLSPSGFDPHAAGYDQVATSDLGIAYRRRVHSVIAPLLRPRSRVLDIGCGTGLDALWLADLGHDVTAIDSSAAMARVAMGRVPETVSVHVQDIDSLDLADLNRRPFDLVLANFGAINCSRDLPRFGRWLTEIMRPGGGVVLVTMTNRCPPELLQAIIKRDRSLLMRRRVMTRRVMRRRGNRPHPGYEGLEVRYRSARGLARELGPGLVLRKAIALGTLMPTFEQRNVVQSRPRLLSGLDAADRLVERPAARLGLGDHQVAVLTRAER